MTVRNGASADSGRPRVRTDQPTIYTLEQAMHAAHEAALKIFQAEGFTDILLVVNVVCTSLDPDDDTTTWAAGSRAPEGNAADRAMLARSLEQSASEVSP